jgi:flavodoxin
MMVMIADRLNGDDYDRDDDNDDDEDDDDYENVVVVGDDEIKSNL